MLPNFQTEQIKESLPKWRFNQAPGLGLNLYQKISPNKTNDSGGIIKPRAKPPDHCTSHHGDENSRSTYPRSSSTRPDEFLFNFHQELIHLRGNDRARTQLERSHLGLEHTAPPGTLTKPWKMPLGESTCSFHLYLCIHSEIMCFKSLGHAKLPKEPANWKESNLKQFGRFILSEPTNPDIRLSSHALMFSKTILKTTCCFRRPKTASNAAPQNCPRRSHLPYTNLPYLEQGAFKPQRFLSDPLRHESRPIKDIHTVPRHSSFGPKLSRLKPSRNLPYLARLLHKFTNGHIHLICTISFCFLVLRML